MVYDLHAIVGPLMSLRREGRRYGSAKVVELPQEMGLIPVTSALLGEVAEHPVRETRLSAADLWILDETVAAWMERNRPDPSTLAVPPFLDLTLPTAEWIADMSRQGTLAYLEDDCFGGDCEQVAVLWSNGVVALGPLVAELGYQTTRLEQLEAPINRALRELGTERGAHGDEFQALDLGRHRGTDEWVTMEYEDDRL